MEEQGVLPSLTDEVQKLRDEIDQACIEATSKKHRRYRKLLPDGDDAGMYGWFRLSGHCSVFIIMIIVFVP